MEETNKHNIFSKEELFKLIDEKKSLPPEADDFDKEAFEGLEMVTNREKLETLNESIDEVLRREAKKAGKKRNMYYFAAAASLLLIVGLFFIMKENTFEKKDTGLAVNETPVNNANAAPVEDKQIEASGKEIKEPAPDFKNATGETTTKEVLKERKLNEEVAAKNQETFAADVTTVNVPPAEPANKLALASNEKSNNGNGAGGVKLDATLEEKKSGGKAGKDDKYVDGDEAQKSEQYKKEEDKKLNKAKEDEKEKTVRYETNTVWTTPADSKDKQLADELKQKAQPQTESKPGTGTTTTDDNRNNQTTTVTTANAPVQTQNDAVVTGGENGDQSKVASPKKSAEVVVSAEQKVSQGPFGKKFRAKKTRAAKTPAFENSRSDNSAGYAYYAQSSTRSFTSPEFVGGDDALQKFVKENLKISSPDKTGTIIAEFLVKKDGSIDAGSIKIVTPLKDCDVCSKDVIELVKTMPKWKPATENGQGKDYLQKFSVLYDVKMTKK